MPTFKRFALPFLDSLSSKLKTRMRFGNILWTFFRFIDFPTICAKICNVTLEAAFQPAFYYLLVILTCLLL